MVRTVAAKHKYYILKHGYCNGKPGTWWDSIEVSTPQQRMLQHPAGRRAYIGGRGSGKTVAGVLASLIEAGRRKCSGLVVAPTYRMIADDILPVVNHWAHRLGVVSQFNKTSLVLTLVNDSTIRFRSAEKPEHLRGPSYSWLWIDEAALLDRYLWRIVLATLREPDGSHRAWVTSTPRGKNWLFDVFTKAPRNYKLIQTTTQACPFTSDDYKRDLEMEYGVNGWAQQELGGEFVDPEGCLFQRDWLKVDPIVPSHFKEIARGWDLAISTKTSADYTAGCKIGITDDETIWVLHVTRGQWGPAPSRETIINTAVSDGINTSIFIEDVQYQALVVDDVMADERLRGCFIDGVKPLRDKLSRALPLASRAKAGKVRLAPGVWNEDFIDELCCFDGSGKTHDDQVDAFSTAWAGCSGGVPSLYHVGMREENEEEAEDNADGN